MEVIRIPQVSLVDSAGKSIGVYTDDPDWWQKLQTKGTERIQTPINQKDSESNTNLRDRLIKEKSIEKPPNQIATIPANQAHLFNEDSHKQCNVIGETPLHIAIMYDDFQTIKLLIETKGFDVNQRCIGGKFNGGFTSKQTNNLIAESKYEGLAYYGEYPLSFAACFASKEIYDYLISKGADPNLQDSNGNTVLHVLVINNKLDMFTYATNHQMKKASHVIKNNQDLTPVNLAAKLGRKDIFEKMLELRNIEFWRYSNITCSAYPLEGLDTIDSDGKIAWNSALSYIVNGDTDDHLDMLEIGVVNRLLKDKWSTYAQKRFFMKLIISAIHLIFLSIAVYTRAPDSDNLAIWPPVSGYTWVRYISEIAVIIGCLATTFLQAQEIYAQGLIYYLKNLKGEPANVFYQIFCIFILCAIPFRFVNFHTSSSFTARNVEDTFVILAIPCGWFHLLLYARVANLTGPFVVMIYKMIIGDILTFASIYVLLLFGFSLGFYYLYKNIGKDVSAMGNYPESLMLSFQMTLGEFKARLEEFDHIYYSDFIKVIFVVFMILMHILLLNMLIAMMGNTYHQIIKKSEKEWFKQWAHVVLLLERSFSPQDLKKFQNKYGINLPSKDKDKNEVGLMVIKKVSQTKAFQKLACNRNWKNFCKLIIAQLKDHKCKGKELLEIWANKDNKPAKSKKQIDLSVFDRKVNGGKKQTTEVSGAAKTANTTTANQEIIKTKFVREKEASKENKETKENKDIGKPPKPDKPLKETEINNNKNTSDFIVKPKNVVQPINDTEKIVNEKAQNTTNIVVMPKKIEKLEKFHEQKSIDESLLSSRSNSGSITQADVESQNNTHSFFRDTHKKTFFPNQVNKIYPMASNSFTSVNSTNAHDGENSSKQISFSPVEDTTGKFEPLNEIKRPPSSSQLLNSDDYIRREQYHRFTNSRSFTYNNITNDRNTDENMSINSAKSSENLKHRTSPHGSKDDENESKNSKTNIN